MSTTFEKIGSFDDIYDNQNEAADKKDSALAAKEEQLEDLIAQLRRDKRELGKKLKKSYLNSQMDSAGIAMDLQVIDKKLEFNEELKGKLFSA